ncbi:pentapeptide repeat-containing protein [Amycolatopsis sp. NPDC058278]
MTFLNKAILRDVQLVGTDLSGASMRDADLRRANFTDAKFEM